MSKVYCTACDAELDDVTFSDLPKKTAQRVVGLGYQLATEDGMDSYYVVARNWVEDFGPFDTAEEAAQFLFNAKGDEA